MMSDTQIEHLPGDFFLAPMRGIGGKAITLAQLLNGDGYMPWQHAGMYTGEGRTVEAMPGGAIAGYIDAYNPDTLLWSSGFIALTAQQRSDIVDTAKSLIGTPYSFVDYLSILALRFGRRPEWLVNYVAFSQHMICSQLVDYCYDVEGVHLFDDDRVPGDVIPADLAHYLLGRTPVKS